jgi:hypothetical protein
MIKDYANIDWINDPLPNIDDFNPDYQRRLDNAKAFIGRKAHNRPYNQAERKGHADG